MDQVADDERVFRAIRNQRNHCRVEEGRLRIGQLAFADRSERPSVDRASLCGDDPSWAQFDVTDGVLQLQVAVIRRHRVRRPEAEYVTDVVADPRFDEQRARQNDAHAVIVPNPAYLKGNAFLKVRESLARLAEETGTMRILPADLRSSE